MKSWEAALILPNASVREAIERIDVAATQMALVVDSERRLLGTLTDGDVRRGLLAGIQLTDSVNTCMCKTPVTALLSDPRDEILSRLRQNRLHQIPILDGNGCVVDLKTVDDFLAVPIHENWVVIMAGGLGSRLKELTHETPKPMLPVGDRPLLETIIARFVAQGFKNIWLAVNYHADKIERHFGDGSDFGANIAYLREKKRMGTAGALSLIPRPPIDPVIVTNADLLATIDYGEMLETHHALNSMATMAVRDYEYQIPFGVVRTSEDKISSLEEKPVHRALVNAGVYVLSPEAIPFIPRDTFFDMPELFSTMLGRALPVHYYRVNGYWLDIGRHEDLQKANADFSNVFL